MRSVTASMLAGAAHLKPRGREILSLSPPLQVVSSAVRRETSVFFCKAEHELTKCQSLCRLPMHNTSLRREGGAKVRSVSERVASSHFRMLAGLGAGFILSFGDGNQPELQEMQPPANPPGRDFHTALCQGVSSIKCCTIYRHRQACGKIPRGGLERGTLEMSVRGMSMSYLVLSGLACLLTLSVIV